jgi:hypothetical protein
MWVHAHFRFGKFRDATLCCGSARHELPRNVDALLRVLEFDSFLEAVAALRAAG